MTIVFLLALAASPALAIILFIYLKDKHEPEPVKPLLIGFLCGVVAFFVSVGIGHFLDEHTEIDKTNLWDLVIYAFLIVGLVEEFSKFFFLRGILYNNKNFNEPFDGIVYSVMIGMGFATTENLFYVLDRGGGAAVLRMFSAVPAHAMFAVIMGFFLGEAKIYKSNELLYSFLALLIATIFHGFYDYFLFISFVPGIWIGAVVSLIVAYFLSRLAIRLHGDISPFKDT